MIQKMLEHLEAYMTVNEIEDGESLLVAGQAILDDEEKEVVNLARKGTILVLFKQFIEGKLTLEQFINNGEELNDELELVQQAGVSFSQPYRREAPGYMMKMLELDDMWGANSLFVLEQGVWDAYAEQGLLEGALEERQSRVVRI